MPEQSTSSSATAADVGHDDFALLDFLILVARHKRFLTTAVVGAAIVSIVIVLLLPPSFRGTARVLPPQQSQSAASLMLGQLGNQLGSLAGGALGLKNPSDLYIGMIKSRTIADALVQRFRLKELYKAKTLEDARKRLERVTAVLGSKDGIITIDVEDEDPNRAAALANAYVEELIRLSQALAITEASRRRLFLEGQLKQAKEQLHQAELIMRQTQEKTGLIKLEEQGKAIIDSIARLQAQVMAKEVQVAAMRAFATDQNPDLLLAQRELAELRAQASKADREQGAESRGIFVPARRVPEVGLEYLRSYRDVKYHEVIFELVAKQYEIAKIDEAKDAAIIQILDAAVAPEKKYKPNRVAISVVVTGLSAFISLLWVFFSEAKDRVRRNPKFSDKLMELRRYSSWRAAG